MQITLEVPEEYLLDSTPDELGKRIQLYASLVMFQAGELSAGAAAEFAGVDRMRFAEACRRHGIALIDYPAEDLRAEFESLRRRVD